MGIQSRAMSSPQPFELDVERNGAHARIVPRGELDIATAPAFERAITDATGEDGKELVIDLRHLTFMDSTGLRALVQADQQARKSGVALTIVRGPESIDRLFSVSGLDELLPLVEAPAPGE